MKAERTPSALLIALAALVSLGLCGQADAMFTGFDDSADETVGANEAAGLGPSESSAVVEGPDAGSRPMVNPFAEGPRFTMPEETPRSVVQPSSPWAKGHRNARGFERLLNGKVTPLAEARPAPKGAAAAKPGADSNPFDYLIGALVVSGLGVIGLLLFRRCKPS